MRVPRAREDLMALVSSVPVEDAAAIREIRNQIHIPLVADIHFKKMRPPSRAGMGKRFITPKLALNKMHIFKIFRSTAKNP